MLAAPLCSGRFQSLPRTKYIILTRAMELAHHKAFAGALEKDVPARFADAFLPANAEYAA
jgi:hypothetical protein